MYTGYLGFGNYRIRKIETDVGLKMPTGAFQRTVSMDFVITCLKNICCPNFCVGAVLYILDILQVCLRVKTWPRLELGPKSYF